MPIVFAVYIASSAAGPVVVFNTLLLQPAGVGISVGVVGSSSAKVGEINRIDKKQIVPICFRLGNSLSVCVCVCRVLRVSACCVIFCSFLFSF